MMVPSDYLPVDFFLEFARDAMACRFEILLHRGYPENGPEAACRALETISFLEQLWSVFIPSSELSIVNARAHEVPVKVSSSTIQLLEQAIEIWQRTKGAFDVTSGKLTKAWGFHGRQGLMPSETDLANALLQVGTKHIALDYAGSSVSLANRVEINPGGIGKGMAIDSAGEILENAGVEHYALHGGKSSIRCRGLQKLHCPDEGWAIAVRHPEQSERILGTLRLHNQSLGTSGPANQFFYLKGKRYGHIIDPRTGWPTDGMLSITVLHPQAGWADALATGLYVLGVEDAIAYCQSNPDTAMLAILPGKKHGQIELVTCNLLQDQWNAH
ncbi:MAG: FAD:protein FMN transferase [Planctomycetota bacterium]|jgi:thiamine biosynthesis lipoprotein|nr:FAD:protein FMN transferase [Planctomycetota bacterium]